MEDQLVSYELAKLAKEVGFDKPCLFAYTSQEDDITDENSAIELQNSYNANGNTYFVSEDIEAATDNGYSRTCLAPTLSLLQKWFREKHNISVSVETGWVNGGFIYDVWIWIKHKEDCIGEIGECLNYEEALEVGLLKACELLKEQQNNEKDNN